MDSGSGRAFAGSAGYFDEDGVCSDNDRPNSVGVYLGELKLFEKFLGADSIEVAKVLTELATCERVAQTERLKYCTRAAEIWELYLPSSIAERVSSDRFTFRDIDRAIADTFMVLSALDHSMTQAAFRREIALWEKALGPDSPAVADVICSRIDSFPSQKEAMGANCKRIWKKYLKHNALTMGHYDSIEFLFRSLKGRCDEEFVEFWRTIFGPSHPTVAMAMSEISCYDAAPAKVARLEQDAMDIWRKNIEQLRTNPRMRDFVYTLFDQVQRSMTKPHQKRSALLRQWKFWREDIGVPHVAKELTSLSEEDGLSEKERDSILASAVDAWERGLASSYRYSSGSHIMPIELSPFESFSRRADLHPNGKSLRRAEVQMWERLRGKSHPEVAAALNRLVKSHRTSQMEVATDLLRASRIWVTLDRESLLWYGPEVEDTFACLASVGRGEYALEAAKQELELWKRAVGRNHPRVAIALTRLADIESLPLCERLAYLKEATSIWKAQHRVDPWLYCGGMRATFKTLSATLEPHERPLVLAEAVTETRRLFGGHSHQLAYALNDLADGIAQSRAEISNGRLTENEKEQCRVLCQEALNIWKEVYSCDVFPSSESQAYADAVEETLWRKASVSKPVDAEALYKQALSMRERGLSDGTDDSRILHWRALQRLAFFYRCTGRFSKAKALYEKTLQQDYFTEELRSVTETTTRDWIKTAIMCDSHNIGHFERKGETADEYLGEVEQFMKFGTVKFNGMFRKRPVDRIGTTVVLFDACRPRTMGPTEIRNVRILQPSGSTKFDREFVDMLIPHAQLLPFPKLPKRYPKIRVSFTCVWAERKPDDEEKKTSKRQ